MRLFAALWLATVLCGPAALAQSVIATQPLPPPPGSPAPLPSRRPVRPAPQHVPVLKPARAPAKHPPVHKPPAKPVAKPPAKPVPHAAPPNPATAALAPAKFDPTKGSTTGLPLPRWAAFRSDDVNLRSGPGMQYPIAWVYHRRDLPVQILREFEVWRLVQEQDGTKGWVHEATLTGRRGYVVQDGEQVLRDRPDDTAAAVAKIEPGVVGGIRHCPAASAWCEVQAGSYHGWLRRSGLYGIAGDETIP